MLGCLRMTIEECEEAYISLAKKIFKPKRWKYDCFSRGLDFFSASERYDSSKLEDVVKAIIKARTGSEQAPLLDLNEGATCKVFVTTVQTEDHQLLLLRSYENKQEVDKNSKQFQLWEALRATSAATTYFKEYRRGNAGYLDGALKSNNPIFQAHREARDLWPDREAFLISIGTGTKPSVPLRGNLIHMARTLTKLVTETEETWSRFKGTHKDMLEDSHLFRYSVPGLGGVDLGNYKLMGMVRTNTERHLREASTEKYVMTCAGKVVEIERKTYASPRPKKAAPLRVEDLSGAEKDCLRDLHATSRDYESQRLGIEKPVPGTCQWFLRHPKFVDWAQGASSPLLWVTANPGCGKSVLTSFLVDALSQKAKDSIVCSFFFKAGIDSRRDAHQALCALLHQLFVVVPELTQTAMEDYSCKDTPSFTSDIAALWKVLLEAAGQVGKRTIVCVVDALDECADGSRSRFIDQLVTTFPSQYPRGTSVNLKFLVTSRPWPSIETRFRNLLAIRLRGENESPALSEDVQRVVEYRVRELSRSSTLSVEAGSIVAKVLSEGADRTFLWVSLVFDAIERLQSRKLSSIERSLEALPNDLNHLYESALTSFVDCETSHRLLSIVLAAKRPLKLEEVNIALSLGEQTTSFRGLEQELEPDAEYTVKELGGFFVRIIDSTVFLVHQTARDFLLSSRVDEFGGPPIPRIDMELAKQSMARTCISYLSLKDLPTRATLPENEEERLNSNKIFLAKLPDWARSFYVYASTTWASYLGGDEVFVSTSNIHQSVRRVCDASKPYFGGWWYFYVEGRFFIGVDPTKLIHVGCRGRHYAHYSTMRGDAAATRGLLEAGTSEATETDAYGYDLLAQASLQRGVEQVRWLLGNHGHSSFELHLSLRIAASKGNMDIVQRLLATQMEINTERPGEPWKSESLTGCAILHPPVLELLLDNGLLVRGEDFVDAATRGKDEALALLLERSSEEVADRTRYLWEALVEATDNGYPRCQKVIYKELSQSDGNQLDPSVGLMPAASRGDACDIRDLVAMGATEGGEVLNLCCSLGDLNTAVALMDGLVYPTEVLHEALLSYYDSNMGLQLKGFCLKVVRQVVSSKGKLHQGFRLVPKFGLCFEASTELLGYFSNKGVRLSRQRYVEATAMVIAMDERFGLWLVNAADELQEDPSLVAKDFFLLGCFWGKLSLVRVLLSQGADVNREDGSGITPLMAATVSGNSDVVRLLLEKGANPGKRCRSIKSRSEAASDAEWELAELCIHVAKEIGWEALEGSPITLARLMGHSDIEEIFEGR
ncbi:NACHT-ankyrin domain protein transcript variant [Colletotrichum tabaci]|uniref:phospholipase A2 n=1 Tax=Colletotrichum tabaci TaxID=1209068 RepID=A0AAV9TL26_9PEZI